MNPRIARLEYDVLWLAVRLHGFGLGLRIGGYLVYTPEGQRFDTYASIVDHAGRSTYVSDTVYPGDRGIESALRGLKAHLIEVRNDRREKARQSAKNRPVPSEGRA